MINKMKIELMKNTLEKVERDIFTSLCKLHPENSLKENRKKAIEFAQLPIVKTRHVGELYKNKVLKESVLSKRELEVLNRGMAIVEEFYLYQSIIRKNNYKILCSPELMESFLTNCKTINQVEKVILTLKKELKNLETEMAKKSVYGFNKSNSDEILIESLDESQKESLTKLGLEYSENDNITLPKLKKLYYDKLYGANSYTKHNIDELSNAFFNVKKAFKVS